MSRHLRTPLERRRRASARVALYASGALCAGGFVGLLLVMFPSLDFGAATRWADVDYAARPEVRRLQQYVAIDTHTEGGDELAGARWVAEQLRSMGLEPVVERVGDQANVWAVLEGRRREAVVLHHHIDVDPVPDPEHWTYEPFAGTIDGPWLYGRGTFDMKSVAVAQLEALRALVASGRRPERSVILLATTGEEVGSDLGTRWFLRRHPELVERFGVVLTEGGAVETTGFGQLKYWGTEFGQDRLVRVLVCSSSFAVLRLVGRSLSLGHGESEPRLVPEVETFLRAYAPTRAIDRLRELLVDPRRLMRDRAAFKNLPAYLRAFFVDKAMPQGIEPAPGGGFQLRLHLLVLPGVDLDDAVAELVPEWATHGVPVRVEVDGGADHGSPLDHWAFRGIDRAVRRHWPGVVHGPLFLPLTLTDARYFRAAGIPTYGFSPFGGFDPDVIELRLARSIDERILLPAFVDGVELYRETLAGLAG